MKFLFSHNVLFCSVTLAVASSVFSQTLIHESFESFAVDQFPAGPWRDIGTSAVPSPALPSGRVIETLDAEGLSTRAFQIYQRDTTSQGLITAITPADSHRIEADIRIDAHPTPVAFGDWTAAVGLFDESGPLIDINAEPQAVLYVYRQRWYFYGSTTPQNATNIELGPASVVAGDWYSVSLEADTRTGVFEVQVRNDAGQLEIDRTVTIAGYAPMFGQYNRIGFFDGEYAVRADAAGQFTVDNIRYIPAPSAGVVLLLAGLTRQRRRP